jgi:hypothetical protein
VNQIALRGHDFTPDFELVLPLRRVGEAIPLAYEDAEGPWPEPWSMKFWHRPSEATAMRAISEATAGTVNAFCLHSAVLAVGRCSYLAVYSPRHPQHPLGPG